MLTGSVPCSRWQRWYVVQRLLMAFHFPGPNALAVGMMNAGTMAGSLSTLQAQILCYKNVIKSNIYY